MKSTLLKPAMVLFNGLAKRLRQETGQHHTLKATVLATIRFVGSAFSASIETLWGVFRFTEVDAVTLLSAYGFHALEIERLQSERLGEASPFDKPKASPYEKLKTSSVEKLNANHAAKPHSVVVQSYESGSPAGF
jgi:hypothetical protein